MLDSFAVSLASVRAVHARESEGFSVLGVQDFERVAVEDMDAKGKVKKKTFVKTTLKPGEHILYEKHAAREVEGDDEELVLVREEDVLGYRR